VFRAVVQTSNLWLNGSHSVITIVLTVPNSYLPPYYIVGLRVTAADQLIIQVFYDYMVCCKVGVQRMSL